MGMIDEVRKHYGISQEWLGIYLGVSRGQLSMAEIGRRELSTAAHLKLTELYTAIAQPGGEGSDLSRQEKNAPGKKPALEILKDKLEGHEHRLQGHTKALQKLLAAQRNAQAALVSLEKLLAGGIEDDKSILKEAQRQAERKLEKNGPGAQADLELQIEAVKLKAAILKKWMKGDGDQDTVLNSGEA